MKKKYRKITKEDVLDVLIDCNLSFINYTDTVSIPNISYLLKTSKYQVRKYINELKKDGLVENGFIHAMEYDTCHLPTKGFLMTKKAEELEKYKIAYKKIVN